MAYSLSLSPLTFSILSLSFFFSFFFFFSFIFGFSVWFWSLQLNDGFPSFFLFSFFFLLFFFKVFMGSCLLSWPARIGMVEVGGLELKTKGCLSLFFFFFLKILHTNFFFWARAPLGLDLGPSLLQIANYINFKTFKHKQ